MAITHAIAHAQPGTHAPPAMLLQYLNDSLTRSYTHGGTFVTAFYAVLDAAGRTLTYSRAGHNPPRLVRGGKVMALDENNALPMGIEPDQEHDQTNIQLEHGDLLLLYTDGITEAAPPPKPGQSRQQFGVQRLDRLLLQCDGATAAQCIECVRSEVERFCENVPLTDDQTLIAIRCA
jgi:sigma-B regulation protein RsbU (phosphoserine phosphatase)